VISCRIATQLKLHCWTQI